MNNLITNQNELLTLLDALFKEKAKFDWNAFYTNRESGVPFFKNSPDENLVQYIESRQIAPSRVLDLGCGPGRNAFYLAQQGSMVDAVDASHEAIKWAKERADQLKLDIHFLLGDIFEMNFEKDGYDFIYDSGCFHHLYPHRRISYLALLEKQLQPGGYFGICSFKPNGELGGFDEGDISVYRAWRTFGGIGYSIEDLTNIFHSFELIEIRQMKQGTDNQFGYPEFNVALFKKPSK